MTPCLFNNSFEITYSPGANNQSFSSHLFYEDIIQISRCSLLKPECFITSDELLKTQNIMERLWALPDKADRPKIHMNELMCGGKDCNLVPNKDVREVIVGLSYACNMNCFHCLYEGHHFDTSLQKELYFHTLNAIKGNELNKITLTNKGEPFFYLSETMNYLRNFTKKDASCVSCITNGNCFGPSQIEELAKISDSNGFSFNISFSVDAISEKTYNLVRTGGDFNKVI